MVIYCRISNDPDDEKKGVTRQAQDCRKLAELREFNLIRKREYVDNNVSAWSGAERSDWNEIPQLAADRKIDGIVTYNIDRVVPRVKNLSLLMDVIEQHGIRIYTVAGGELDLSTPGGVMVAQILASVAEHESSIKSVRVIRSKGYPMNSRRLRDMLITGRTPRLRVDVAAPKARGRQVSHLSLVPKVQEQNAAWDPIIRDDEWLACRSILLDPKRTRGKVRRSRSLLARVILYGECGGYISVGSAMLDVHEPFRRTRHQDRGPFRPFRRLLKKERLR